MLKGITNNSNIWVGDDNKYAVMFRMRYNCSHKVPSSLEEEGADELLTNAYISLYMWAHLWQKAYLISESNV